MAFRKYIIVVICALLFGCATTKNIDLKENFWHNQNKKVLVARTEHVKPQMYAMGQQGLLDIVINQQMMRDMTQYLERHDLTWYANFQNRLEKDLHQQHVKTTSYQTEVKANDYPSVQKDINQYAKNNFGSLGAAHQSELLLLTRLEKVGVIRNYHGFIPLGPPRSVCNLTGELIDLTDHHILWRYQAKVELPIEGEWDQPPNYPNAEKSLQRAILLAQQEVRDSLFSGY